MGPPDGNREGYAWASNRTHADQLTGKLLLVHGTADRDVPAFLTLKLVKAFMEAGKHVDLMFLPDRGHNLFEGGDYVSKATANFLQEHLLETDH